MTKTITINCLAAFLLMLSFKSNAQNASVSISPAGPTVCEGTVLSAVTTGMTGPFTYLWSNGATTPTITINRGGSYRVRVTGTTLYNGVRTVSSALVPYTVIVEPHPSIYVNGSTNLCPGDSVKLTGKFRRPYYTYSWNTGQTTPTIWANQSGTYVLTTSTNVGGCNYSASTSVDINVLDNGYQPAVNALSALTVCKPGYVNLAGDPGFASYEWHWYDGTPSGGSSTNQSVSILMDGAVGATLDTATVYLTVTLSGGCSYTSSGTVIRSIRQTNLRTQDCGKFTFHATDSIKSDPVLSYIYPTQFEFEFESTVNPGVTWTHLSTTQWCRFSDVTPALQPGSFYNVRVRPVINGDRFCYGTPCQIGLLPLRPEHNSVTLSERMVGTAINTEIYPNPSNSEFNLTINSEDENTAATVTITDLSGRIIEIFTMDGSKNTIQFGKSLQNGLYLVTVQQGEFKNITKILKSN